MKCYGLVTAPAQKHATDDAVYTALLSPGVPFLSPMEALLSPNVACLNLKVTHLSPTLGCLSPKVTLLSP